jgi:hypothetical protein
MAVKRLYCKCLAVRCRSVTVGLTLTVFTFFGTFLNPPPVIGSCHAVGADAKNFGSGDDPYPFIEEAQRYLSRLLSTTAGHLRLVSAEFDVERSLRIQEALFREDLVWLNRGYSPKQMDLMVFITVALSLETTGEVRDELRRSLDDNLDPKVMRRLKAVELYQSQAVAMLRRLSRELETLPNREFRFHY